MLQDGTERDNLLPHGALEAARAVVDLVLGVLPLHTAHGNACSCRGARCTAVGKHPRTARGVHDATTAPGTIEAWWSFWPDANIGIATGTPLDEDRLLVLDIDPRNGGDATLERLEWELGLLPHTAQVITGGDGIHFYVRVPASLRPRASLGPGIDVKFAGGYVVAPPSVHASGRAYRWAHGRSLWEAVVASLPPDWLAATARPPRGPKFLPRTAGSSVQATELEARARRYARALPGAVAGQRGHDVTFIAASKIARGFRLDAETAFRVLWEEWNPCCDPPWDERDLRRKVDQVLQHGGLPLGGLVEKARRAR